MFGIDRKSVAYFEEHPDKQSTQMDLFWPGKFLVEMKSLGYSLDKAMVQAFGYYTDLKKDEEPRYMLACDFQNWYLRDKKENTDHFFKLSNLADSIGLFGFMTNRPKVIQSDPVNIKASEMLGKIFDALKESGYPRHQVEYFLTRLVFCLFADDTGIFGDHGKFQTYLKESTNEDGSDLGRYLAYLFGVLNQDNNTRSKLMDSKTRSFPYINGALFEKPVEFPDFDGKMRTLLIDAGNYDWSKVSPAIFGNMFQTVMDQDARREMGAHYTSEENILKVIRPLFLDKLNAEFDEIFKVADDSRKEKFVKFQNKLSNLKFLDPACGSGNFLIIAYREIRRLEHRVIMDIYGYDGTRSDTDELSKVGNYIFNNEEKVGFLEKEPHAEFLFRPFVNAREFINGGNRWILKLQNAKPNELRNLPEIKKRIAAVKLFRSNSKRKGTKKLAETPTLFQLNVIPTKSFLVFPANSSERREYVPIGYLEPPIMPSNALMIVENADLKLFGLVTSKMHMVWLRTVGGKLKIDLRYSAGMVYNTFPIPAVGCDNLTPYAKKILEIHDKYSESTLADLYDPVAMPSDLKKAHQHLDQEVEKLYRKEPFASDQQRIEFLLDEYQKMKDNDQTKLK